VCSLRAAWCLLFLCLLPCSAQTPTSLVHQPVTERQLLCWIVAGVPAFNLQSELQNRGMEFALDQNWLEGLKAAGADAYFWGVAEAYEHLNRVEEAIAAYKRAKDLAPDDMRIRQNLGAAYCNSGRSEQAVAEFQELLALDSDWNMARMCLYKSLRRLGRMEEAAAVKAEYDKREAGGGD